MNLRFYTTLSLMCALTIGPFASAANHEVVMKSISYDPKVLEIHIGDSVEWTNKSYTEHSATSNEETPKEDKFDTEHIKPKSTSKKIVFQHAGKLNYHCTIHGKTMSGQIVVLK